MNEPDYIKCHILKMDGTVKDCDISPDKFSFDYTKYLYNGELYFKERMKDGKLDNMAISKDKFDELVKPKPPKRSFSEWRERNKTSYTESPKKTKSTMKVVVTAGDIIKISVYIIIIILCIAFVTRPRQSNVNNYSNSGKNQYYIDIIGSRLGKDYLDNDVLIVRYKFTHTLDEPKAFGYVFDDKIYQNGIECKRTYMKSPDITEDYKYSEIQPNTTVEFETSYGLNDLYSPVDVEITKTYSDTVVYSKRIELQ